MNITVDKSSIPALREALAEHRITLQANNFIYDKGKDSIRIYASEQGDKWVFYISEPEDVEREKTATFHVVVMVLAMVSRSEEGVIMPEAA